MFHCQLLMNSVEIISLRTLNIVFYSVEAKNFSWQTDRQFPFCQIASVESKRFPLSSKICHRSSILRLIMHWLIFATQSSGSSDRWLIVFFSWICVDVWKFSTCQFFIHNNWSIQEKHWIVWSKILRRDWLDFHESRVPRQNRFFDYLEESLVNFYYCWVHIFVSVTPINQIKGFSRSNSLKNQTSSGLIWDSRCWFWWGWWWKKFNTCCSFPE